VIALACLAVFQVGTVKAGDAVEVAQEQRIEIVIRDSSFLLSKPSPIRLESSTVIVLHNEDSIRHGFTSPMLFGVLVHAEGGGIVTYGKGVEGFYVDPGKTLVIRFRAERPGSYAFRCDLHHFSFGMMALPTDLLLAVGQRYLLIVASTGVVMALLSFKEPLHQAMARISDHDRYSMWRSPLMGRG
jgi:plastocyanin